MKTEIQLQVNLFATNFLRLKMGSWRLAPKRHLTNTLSTTLGNSLCRIDVLGPY